MELEAEMNSTQRTFSSRSSPYLLTNPRFPLPETLYGPICFSYLAYKFILNRDPALQVVVVSAIA